MKIASFYTEREALAFIEAHEKTRLTSWYIERDIFSGRYHVIDPD